MNYKEYKEKQLQNTTIKKEYDSLQQEYNGIQTEINKKEQNLLYEDLMEGLTEALNDINLYGELQGRKTVIKL